MKKISISLALLIGLALVACAQFNRNSGMQKLLNAQYAISNFYVDTVNNDKLVEEAIKGMLESLDPYTNFIDELIRDYRAAGGKQNVERYR